MGPRFKSERWLTKVGSNVIIFFMRDYFNISKRWWFVVLVTVLALLALLIVFSGKNKNTDIVIILSPHYDDAVLSLGGLITSRNSNTVVATFFTGTPAENVSGDWDKKSGFESSDTAMSFRLKENQSALGSKVKTFDFGYLDNEYRNKSDSLDDIEIGITKDIQNLITSYGTTTQVVVYGPSVFKADITNTDHKLLFDAYLQVMQDFPQKNVTFRFYEDFPYILRFNKESVISLKKNLEIETGFLVSEVEIPLKSAEVNSKVGAIKKYASQVQAFKSQGQDILKDAENYTRTRCGNSKSSSACEVVYEIFLVKE